MIEGNITKIEVIISFLEARGSSRRIDESPGDRKATGWYEAIESGLLVGLSSQGLSENKKGKAVDSLESEELPVGLLVNSSGVYRREGKVHC
jgi:hypothetical protein